LISGVIFNNAIYNINIRIIIVIPLIISWRMRLIFLILNLNSILLINKSIHISNGLIRNSMNKIQQESISIRNTISKINSIIRMCKSIIKSHLIIEFIFEILI
jgi:hypothetical protein